MRCHRRQRGEGQIGCIFGLIVLIAVSYIAFKMIPVKVRAADLRQEITDVARSAAMYKDPVIRKRILEKAEELDLPLDPGDLEIIRKSDRILIEATYVVPVEFPGYTYYWNFRHTVDNPVF